MDCIVHGVAKSWAQVSDFHFPPLTYIEILFFSCFEISLVLHSMNAPWFI